MIVIVIMVTLLVSSVFLRAYPSVRYSTGIDSFYHLLVAKHIQASHRLPKTLSEFFYHGPYAYPPLLHIILALIHRRGSRVFALLCDSLHAALVFLAALFLGSSVVTGILGAVVFLSLPLNYADSLSTNPRPLGSLFLTASILTLGFGNDYRLWLLFVASYGLMLFSHKMTAQVSWFVLGVIAITNPAFTLPIGVLVPLSMALCVLVSRGFYWKVLKEHVGYLRFHFSFGNLAGRKSFLNPKVIIKSNPFLFLIPLVLFVDHSAMLHGPIVTVLVSWVVATVVIASLWRFGDAHRFLSLASSPTALIIALSNNTIVAVLSMVLCIYFLWRQVVTVSRIDAPFLMTGELLRCYEFVKGVASHAPLLCLPLSYSYSAAYLTGKTVLAADASVRGLIEGFKLSRKVEDATQLEKILRESEPLVFLDKRLLPRYKEIVESAGAERLYSSERYSVWQVR